MKPSDFPSGEKKGARARRFSSPGNARLSHESKKRTWIPSPGVWAIVRPSGDSASPTPGDLDPKPGDVAADFRRRRPTPHEKTDHDRNKERAHRCQDDRAAPTDEGPVSTDVDGRAHGFLEIDARVAYVPEPFFRIFLEAPAQELAEPTGRARKTGPVRLALDDRCHHVGDQLAFERFPSRQHLEDDAAEREDVAPLVDAQAARLFGAHVRRRPEDDPRLGRVSGHRRGQRRLGGSRLTALDFGEPEIEHLDLTVGCDLNVRRFEIPVNDAVLVGGFEGIDQLARDRQHVGDGKRSLLNLRREALLGHELHDEIVEAVRLFEAVDRGNVWVVQRREDARLALEARHPVLVFGEVLGKHFDGDVTPELSVPRPVDFTHAARAERCEDLVVRESAAGRQPKRGHQPSFIADYPPGGPHSAPGVDVSSCSKVGSLVSAHTCAPEPRHFRARSSRLRACLLSTQCPMKPAYSISSGLGRLDGGLIQPTLTSLTGWLRLFGAGSYAGREERDEEHDGTRDMKRNYPRGRSNDAAAQLGPKLLAIPPNACWTP